MNLYLDREDILSFVQGKRLDPILHRVEQILREGTPPAQVEAWLQTASTDGSDANPLNAAMKADWPRSAEGALRRFKAAVLNHAASPYLTAKIMEAALRDPSYPEGAQAIFFNKALTPEVLRDLLPGVERALADVGAMTAPEELKNRVAWREFLHRLAARGAQAGWTRTHPSVARLWSRVQTDPQLRSTFVTSVLATQGSTRSDLDAFWLWYPSPETAEPLVGGARGWGYAITAHPTSGIADWRRLYDSWGQDNILPGPRGARGMWGQLATRADALLYPWVVTNVLRYVAMAPEVETAYMIKATKLGSWAGVRDYVFHLEVPQAQRELGLLAFLEAAPLDLLKHITQDDWARCHEAASGDLRQAAFLRIGASDS